MKIVKPEHLPNWSSLGMPVLGSLSISLAIWFGFLWSGQVVLMNPWVRGGVIALILGSVALAAWVQFYKRLAAAQALEKTLIAAPVGDGAVLADRMQDALAKLKKKGGATALDDLPWYIIIGPPGAGKTTALVNSGLEFPGTDKAAVAGFGGTKNCDFWFTDEAVLIDTAGRYTTQDSDKRADGASWQAFLDQLISARPKQPVNGVILAFSCDDILTSSSEALDTHALTIRNRLAEIHDTLSIDVPVYVMFTKADRIAGFREFFSAFGEDRRRSVWGVTFQTRNRKDETYKSVALEFDALMSRLSSEASDRLNEEGDSVARIATFGFPTQMARLRPNVVEFLRRVFHSSQDIHAVLRGFYFTSGTQEGTPIDQVLGTMAGHGGYPSQFMSGKGRSYFLQDLLQKVIFAERDWVGYNRLTALTRAVLRGVATTAIVVLTVSALALFGYSFWENATLVRLAGRVAQAYESDVQSNPVLQKTILSDPDPRPVMGALAGMRDFPMGWGNPQEQDWVEHMGLSRRASIRRSALVAYSDALERHLRPRMMLQLENDLQIHIARQEIAQAYRALKVYILVAKQQPGQPDDGAVKRYFASAWVEYFSQAGLEADYSEVNDHLAAMLDLDATVTPRLKPNQTIVDAARGLIVTLSLAQQAYSTMLSEAGVIAPFRLLDRFDDGQADLVFQTVDGRKLTSLAVPGFYTFAGYWSNFRVALDAAAQRLEQDAWVVGGPELRIEGLDEIARLNREIHALYRDDFTFYWDNMLERVELRSMSAGAPDYPALTRAGTVPQSPILRLAEAVDHETRLSRFLDKIEGLDRPTETATRDNFAGQSAKDEFSNIESSKRAFQRRQVAGIERRFRKWHRFVAGNGAARARPVDVLMAGLSGIADTHLSTAGAPSLVADLRELDAAIDALGQNTRGYPDRVGAFVKQVEDEFQLIWSNAVIDNMQQALTKEITVFCRQNIEKSAPFTAKGDRLSEAMFEAFFGSGGRMETYFQTYLREHTQRDGQGELMIDTASPLSGRVSPEFLRQFSRAERIRQAFFLDNADRSLVNNPINDTDVAGTAVAFSGLAPVEFTSITGLVPMPDLQEFQCPINVE